MYELVEKKRPWVKVVLSIVVLFIVTSVIRELLQVGKIPLNQQLIQVANDLNKHAPIIVDSTVRFDNATALQGNKLQFNYTYLGGVASDVDTVALAETSKNYMLNVIRTNPKMSTFKENNVDLALSYMDSNGVYICTIGVDHKDY